jgi:anti-anti-sigma factor
MKVEEQKIGEILIYKIEGRMDSSTSPSLETTVLSAIDSGNIFIGIDCSKIDFISSAGLRVLLMAAKRVGRDKGKLGLFGLRDHIKEIFDISGFTSIFPMFTTQEELTTGLL